MKTHAIARHSYAIKVLGKLPGFFQPQRYAYYCVRCKWSFLVNDGRRGVVTALDASAKPLERIEAAKRVATFTDGPCPSMKVFGQAIPRPLVLAGTKGDSNGPTSDGVTTNGSTSISIEHYRHREQRRRVNSYLS